MDERSRLKKSSDFYVHAPVIDNPIGMLRDRNLNGSFEDDEIYYFTKDHLGSVREIVGLDGKIKQRQRYSAYGRTTKEKNDSELSRLIDQPYGFTSREHDGETGMYYYRARYYDPSVGRFVTEDPIGFEGEDYNLYRYVGNNPIRYNDPSGLKYRTCKRKLEGMPVMAGPFYHEYIDFDSGSDFSFSPTGSMFGSPGQNISEDSGNDSCGKWSKDSKDDSEIRKRARQNMSKEYDVLNYNCQDFVFDTLRGF